MSFRARLIHSLAIVTPTDSGTVDADGMPVAGAPVVETVSGLIQPRTARERGLPSQAGPTIATHVIYLESRAIDAGAWIRDNPDTGRRFDITGVRTYDFGRTPHLEVDALLVSSPALDAVAP
jgi:hypothetical protein